MAGSSTPSLSPVLSAHDLSYPGQQQQLSSSWAQGSQICNVDSQMMPHYRFQAVCNHCEDFKAIPFALGLGREMRKHYNEKHRLLCNACKKGDFGSKTELHEYVYQHHNNRVCLQCHASFDLASAMAMHIEGPKNNCAVPHSDFVSALRCSLEKQTGVTDPNAVYSPISCGPNMVHQLKEFWGTLRLAYKLAYGMQQESSHQSPASPAESEHYTGSHALLVLGGARARCDQEINSDSSLNSPKEIWTCTTCTAKFTSLSKLLQHVESKAKDNLWKDVLSN